VTKRFEGESGQVTALEDISLEVREGEFLAVVGPSGCGKSTLLSLLAGLEHTNEGEIRLGDQPVTAPGRDRLVMFQQDALFPWLNALENVLFGLRLKPALTDAERLESARYYLNLVGLGNKEKARPHELSGGMRQRVALARSLAPNPRVLLMDEPFSALDALTRTDLQLWLEQIWERERWTVVLITHDVREAVLLSDRVYVLGPRPATVRLELEIPLPRPRTLETLADPQVAALEHELLMALDVGAAPA
jgi:NitT/TauT family transport system ATP-binding protein